jgi:CRISPR/Cas system CSM-associated protein Csm2 small subunit
VWVDGGGCHEGDGPAATTSTDPSGLSDSELVNKTEATATEMRVILNDYLTVYDETQALNANSWKQVVNQFHSYSPEIDSLLMRAAATQEELRQLLDEVIDRGLIASVSAGKTVDPQDYREYVAVIGEWVSNQQQQNRETSVCLEKHSKKQGFSCVIQIVVTTGAKGQEIAARMNSLQASLFGSG